MSLTEQSRPKVGVAVFIMKDGTFIMGHRIGAHGADTWGLPGGHLEFGETWEECVVRETSEEVGLTIKNIRFLAATNDVFVTEAKHYITIFMLADWAGGTAQILEPDRCKEIAWFTYETMPKHVFLPLVNLKRQHPNLLLV